MERTKSSKKWWICLSGAGVLAAGVLLFFLHPTFESARTWAAEVLYAGAGPKMTVEAGHGPVARPDAKAPDDLSVRLHPERHVSRATETVELEWHVTKGWRWPDGVGKEVYLINGQFPAPSVEVRSGDELLVTVHNELPAEDIWIHWHGLRSEEAEGVLGLTRCAIAANESYTYRLQVPLDVHGTFWYCSQVGTQRADGLFGALVVHEPLEDSDGTKRAQAVFRVQEEQLLVVNDWYHKPSEEIWASYYSGEYFDAAPAADSILLNGRGYFDCSKAYNEPGVDCKHTDVRHLTLPDRARVRIVNAGSLVGFTISTVGYTMTLLEIDGGSTVERVASEKIGKLYPGQRMDVLFERHGSIHNESAWITVALDRESMQYPNLALTDTQQFHIATTLVSTEDALERGGPVVTPSLDLSAVHGTGSRALRLDSKADSVIVVNVSMSYDGKLLGLFNDISWTPCVYRTSIPGRGSRTEDQKSRSPLLVPVAEGALVDIIVNNLESVGEVLHVHGLDVHVLRIGQGQVTAPNENENRTEVSDPPMRDTVFIPGDSHAVLRLRADRVGLWSLRSSILWHDAAGMHMAIQIGEDEDMASKSGLDRSVDLCHG